MNILSEELVIIFISRIIFNYFAAMDKKFRIICITLIGGLSLFSCVKKTNKNEIEESLKTAMWQSLYQQHPDSSIVKFKVLTVSYFEAKKGYICEFKVNMKQKMPDRLIDTIGYMSANVSKDFTTVSRKY
jgi:hypothetical protein